MGVVVDRIIGARRYLKVETFWRLLTGSSSF